MKAVKSLVGKRILITPDDAKALLKSLPSRSRFLMHIRLDGYVPGDDVNYYPQRHGAHVHLTRVQARDVLARALEYNAEPPTNGKPVSGVQVNITMGQGYGKYDRKTFTTSPNFDEYTVWIG